MQQAVRACVCARSVCMSCEHAQLLWPRPGRAQWALLGGRRAGGLAGPWRRPPLGSGPPDACPTSVPEAGKELAATTSRVPLFALPPRPGSRTPILAPAAPGSALCGHIPPAPPPRHPECSLHQHPSVRPGLGSQLCFTAVSPTPHTTDRHHWLPWRTPLGNIPRGSTAYPGRHCLVIRGQFRSIKL